MLAVYPQQPGAPAAHDPDAVADHPVYWFAVMEDAKDRGDFETAARAKRELERLGVLVSYRRQKGGGHVT